MPEQLQRKNLCPLLKKPCVGLECNWYMQLSGTDPQDKTKNIDGWDCAIKWQVWAQLEVAKRVSGGLDGVQKATESFRNEVSGVQNRIFANPLATMIGTTNDESDNRQG